jgi:hypothetical protein
MKARMASTTEGFRMKTVFAILLLITHSAIAADISIVDVRRNIPLSDEEPAVKDFYINAGSDDGIKKNLVVMVYRGLNVRDASGAQSYGEIVIPVGQLQVIAVYQKLSVAREYKILARDENPMLEQAGIMNGDKVELKDSFVGRRPQSTKKPVVTSAPALPTPIPITAEVVASPVISTPVEITKTADNQTNPVNNTTLTTTPPEQPAAPVTSGTSQP